MDLNPTFGTQEFLETLSGGGSAGHRSPDNSAGAGSGSLTSTRSGSRSGGNAASAAAGAVAANAAARSRSTGSSPSSGRERRRHARLQQQQEQQQQQQQQQQSQQQKQPANGSNSQVDEAYRRLGQRLSLQAHGDVVPLKRLPYVHLEPVPQKSCFQVFEDHQKSFAASKAPSSSSSDAVAGVPSSGNDSGTTSETSPGGNGAGKVTGHKHASSDSAAGGGGGGSSGTSSGGAASGADSSNVARTQKVAKTRYSDHGDHHTHHHHHRRRRIRNRSKQGAMSDDGHKNLLRALTFEAKHSFKQWEEQHLLELKQRAADPSSTTTTTIDTSVAMDITGDGGVSLTPQQYAFSKLTLDQQQQQQQQQQVGSASATGPQYQQHPPLQQQQQQPQSQQQQVPQQMQVQPPSPQMQAQQQPQHQQFQSPQLQVQQQQQSPQIQQQYAGEMLGAGGVSWGQQQQQPQHGHHHHHHQHHHHHRRGASGGGGGGGGLVGLHHQSKGLLSAVLEGHSDSATSVSGARGNGSRTGTGGGRSKTQRDLDNSPGSQSISTKDTKDSLGFSAASRGNGTGGHHGGSVSQATTSASGSTTVASSVVAPVRGKCLTVPIDAVANDGLDNAEGNLIVYENDNIHVARKSIHTFQKRNRALLSSRTSKSTEFRVQSLLGQGTFAQVFQCLHVTTGKLVAVKIVKNKPAYTRQATVEIDVFRALQEQEKAEAATAAAAGIGTASTTTATTMAASMNSGGGPTANSNGAAGTEGGAASSSTTAATAGDSGDQEPKDYMVNLICYFMHRSHLCLVFELLGLNLYEVLKRRQFRGLPLTMVRSIVARSVEGVKQLSQKGIVHCDLKPENILFVSDQVGTSVVRAGEIVTQSTSSGGTKGQGQQHQQQQQHSQLAPSGGCSAGGSSGKGTEGSNSGGGVSSGSSSMAVTIQMGNSVPTIRPIGTDCGIKLIDFGSACFEGYTAHTYIQSRFYRSPEVLVGLPYDSAIDMWSLGCVAAELFLGLPILPGVHEHDQLGRVAEMIAKIPDWMLDQGSKASKYFVKYVARPPTVTPFSDSSGSPAPPAPQWRLKTQQEYISSLSQSDIKKKGGLLKLEKQPGNRYFKRKRLPDILALHGHNTQGEDKELLPAFIHFLYGMLDPDPWKRWTAFQALQHPFVTGQLSQLKPKTPDVKLDPKETNQANIDLEHYWQPPWDPAFCRRKLLNVQKTREKQQAMRRNLSNRASPSQMGGAGESLLQANDRRGLSRRSGCGTEPPLSAGGVPMQPNVIVANVIGAGPGFPNVRPADSSMGSSPPTQVGTSVSTGTDLTQSSTVFGTRGNSTVTSTTGPLIQMVTESLGGTQTKLSSGQGTTNSDGIGGPQERIIASTQSFAGISYERGRTPTEGDFGYALQRPGVVPGRNPESFTSVGAQSIASSRGYGQQQMYGGQSTSSFPQTATTPLPQGNYLTASASIGQAPGMIDPQLQLQQQLLQQQQQQQQPQLVGGHTGAVVPGSAGFVGRQYGAATVASSAASSVTMGDGNTYGQQQPQQQGIANVDLQQQLAILQQQQQLALLQQQQQFAIQQQPIMMAQAGGGGYYYVTTSATGQPMLLQPVGLMGQPQQMMSPQQPQAQPQQQMMSPQQPQQLQHEQLSNIGMIGQAQQQQQQQQMLSPQQQQQQLISPQLQQQQMLSPQISQQQQAMMTQQQQQPQVQVMGFSQQQQPQMIGFPQQQPQMMGFPQQQPPQTQMMGFAQQQQPQTQMMGFPQQQQQQPIQPPQQQQQQQSQPQSSRGGVGRGTSM